MKKSATKFNMAIDEKSSAKALLNGKHFLTLIDHKLLS